MPVVGKITPELLERVKRLRIPQIRVLRELAGDLGLANVPFTPALTRIKLQQRCEFSEKSGTVTRVMNGVQEGSSSGAARPGLLELELVKTYILDIDGLQERVYQLTDVGRFVVKYLAQRSLPKKRGADVSTNLRYLEDAEQRGYASSSKQQNGD